MKRLVFLAAGLLSLPLLVTAPTSATETVVIDEFRPDEDAWCRIREQWVDTLLATYPEGSWAPMRFDPTDEQLALLGLPSREVLMSSEFPVPTAVYPDGTQVPLAMPGVAAYAGTGCFGIRPGAFLLLLDDGVGWCSMAHVYGSPGNYAVSTAGHCGSGGHRATAIGAIGNGIPVLLDFGKFRSSTDGGIGNDQALIDVYPQYQHLVSPTMCFWGGPLGVYTKTGAVVSASLVGRGGRFDPSWQANPDPFLAQTIVHYGHGIGLGAGGTPRAGEAIHWGSSHFAFFGAISPGDSGSGSNTLGGDAVGAVNEAAGINTHIYVDPTLKTGLGFMAGTRATKVGSNMAIGQIVPYPVPLPGAP